MPLLNDEKPLIVCVWHGEQFPLPLCFQNHSSRIMIPVSQSQDGEIASRLLTGVGYVTVRGSSSRGGLRALLEMTRLMKEKRLNVCITVDGPRGPYHEIKDGVFFLSAKTDATLIAARMIMPKGKTFRSWDRFRIPFPFTEVEIYFSEPWIDRPDLRDPESMRNARERLKKKLEETGR